MVSELTAVGSSISAIYTALCRQAWLTEHPGSCWYTLELPSPSHSPSPQRGFHLMNHLLFHFCLSSPLELTWGCEVYQTEQYRKNLRNSLLEECFLSCPVMVTRYRFSLHCWDGGHQRLGEQRKFSEPMAS